MRITAIQNYHTNPNFYGDKKKSNKLKNAAGVATIAIATTIPAEESKAQIYYPTINYITVPVSNTQMYKVPNCFITGNKENPNPNKTKKEIFDELDINGNGALSANEVVNTEQNNWNKYMQYIPFSQKQVDYTARQFNLLSEQYNEDDSNPNTINYNEYKSIMDDYEEIQKNTIYMPVAVPGIIYPTIPHHHHHRHDAPPPPHRRHHRH